MSDTKKETNKLYKNKNIYEEDDNDDITNVEEDETYDELYNQLAHEDEIQKLGLNLFEHIKNYSYEHGLPLGDLMSYSDMYAFLYSH
jgi:hypothetical protein